MVAYRFACLLAFALTSVALAQESSPSPPNDPATIQDGGGVVYGAHHAVAISAPPGWVLDTQAGAREGLHAVLYRSGETYADAPGILYVRGEDFEPGHAPTLDDYIANDLAAMRKASPGVETSELPAITLRDGTVARVVGYRGDKWGNVEAVAYFIHDDSILLMALSTRSQARFDADLDDFRCFVAGTMPMDGGSDDATAATSH